MKRLEARVTQLKNDGIMTPENGTQNKDKLGSYKLQNGN